MKITNHTDSLAQLMAAKARTEQARGVEKNIPTSPTVLRQAVTHAAERLKIPESMLSSIIGINIASVQAIPEGGKEWDRAVQFVRAFQALERIVGSAKQEAVTWIHTDNSHLNAKPLDLLSKDGGLDKVLQYLESIR